MCTSTASRRRGEVRQQQRHRHHRRQRHRSPPPHAHRRNIVGRRPCWPYGRLTSTRTTSSPTLPQLIPLPTMAMAHEMFQQIGAARTAVRQCHVGRQLTNQVHLQWLEHGGGASYGERLPSPAFRQCRSPALVAVDPSAVAGAVSTTVACSSNYHRQHLGGRGRQGLGTPPPPTYITTPTNGYSGQRRPPTPPPMRPRPAAADHLLIPGRR